MLESKVDNLTVKTQVFKLKFRVDSKFIHSSIYGDRSTREDNNIVRNTAVLYQ